MEQGESGISPLGDIILRTDPQAMVLVDAHVHLPAYADIGTPVQVAVSTSTCLLSCTVKPEEAQANLSARASWPRNVRCFLGVHPSEASIDLPSSKFGALFESCDGIGEIGLDEKYSTTSAGGAQMESFVDQLRAAEKLGKPVEVHSRGSEQLCLEVLTTFRIRSVLMHWFEGESLASEVASRGYLVSFGPALLYSKKIRRIARSIPEECLLTESDGPVAYRPLGGASGPSLIPSVLLALAEVRGTSYERMEKAVEENAKRLLGEERLI